MGATGGRCLVSLDPGCRRGDLSRPPVLHRVFSTSATRLNGRYILAALANKTSGGQFRLHLANYAVGCSGGLLHLFVDARERDRLTIRVNGRRASEPRQRLL